MTEPTVLDVEAEQDGERLDAFLAARLPGLSRTLAATLARDGKALVNGEKVKPSHRVKVNDRIEARAEIPRSLSAAPEEIRLQLSTRTKIWRSSTSRPGWWSILPRGMREAPLPTHLRRAFPRRGRSEKPAARVSCTVWT